MALFFLEDWGAIKLCTWRSMLLYINEALCAILLFYGVSCRFAIHNAGREAHIKISGKVFNLA